MALENYLKPEYLTEEGDNQWKCTRCDKKRDAQKGLKLTKCPSIMSLSLMRFAVDYETFNRVKVTERVSFPMTLNLNDYLQGYEGIETKLYDKEVERMKAYQSGAIEKNLKKEN
jgi:ubiquitin C-terminal hydrolase